MCCNPNISNHENNHWIDWGGVFEYWFVFIFGVLCGMLNILKSRYLNKITIFSLIVFIISICVIQIFNPLLDDTINLNFKFILYIIGIILLRILYGISFFFIMIKIYNQIKFKPWIEHLIVMGAFASYGVYLFDKSYFAFINYFIQSYWNISPVAYNLLFILIFLPTLFILCYYLQKTENRLISTISRRRSNRYAKSK